AADTAVHFSGVPERMKPPLDVPFDTGLWRAIERAARERDPGATVTPSMSTGGTDRPTYRALGIVTYGFGPFRTDEAEAARRGAHGNDERISVENLGFGVRFLYDVIRYVQ
ncbi:MAG: M20/M25/M40 family metallo-hydrolase, partial [Gemmatimonadetes bacterium]|nr:M20/M25/M40 family metallo-hydrolase [Gemmatimonadota bacterium]